MHLGRSACDKKWCNQYDALHKRFKDAPNKGHRGYVRTITGRRSRFPDNYKVYRALNRVISGTAADINKRKLVELHKARKQTGFLMRATVHDEVFGDSQADHTLKAVDEILNHQSFPELKVPIIWECNEGANWAESK
jgi:DNA polymerase I-like protein with 3'-5' exonuclease and polymerase domains